MNRRRLLVTVVSLGIVLANSAIAGSKKKEPPATVQSPTIAAVTADSITVKEAHVTKTLTITQFTEINVNGRRATAGDLKPGMIVNVTLGTDSSKVSRINATAK